MSKLHTDEQYPLLVHLVDHPQSLQNERYSTRLQGITSGATALLTQWPSHVGKFYCILSMVVLFLVFSMWFSCASLEPVFSLPTCPPRNLHSNNTIHLVHSHNWTKDHVDMIRNLTKRFPNFPINIILIVDQNLKAEENNSTRSVSRELASLIWQYPSISASFYLYNEFFRHTPLYLHWFLLSEEMKMFAVRIILVFQHGGISYDFENIDEKAVQTLIQNGPKRYSKLGPEKVSVDLKGLHMEVKIPCHVFFGKVMMKLAKIGLRGTPTSVLRGPMILYCRLGVIDMQFCIKSRI